MDWAARCGLSWECEVVGGECFLGWLGVCPPSRAPPPFTRHHSRLCHTPSQIEAQPTVACEQGCAGWWFAGRGRGQGARGVWALLGGPIAVDPQSCERHPWPALLCACCVGVLCAVCCAVCCAVLCVGSHGCRGRGPRHGAPPQATRASARPCAPTTTRRRAPGLHHGDADMQPLQGPQCLLALAGGLGGLDGARREPPCAQGPRGPTGPTPGTRSLHRRGGAGDGRRDPTWLSVPRDVAAHPRVSQRRAYAPASTSSGVCVSGVCVICRRPARTSARRTSARVP